jgi:hypothetical protein
MLINSTFDNLSVAFPSILLSSKSKEKTFWRQSLFYNSVPSILCCSFLGSTTALSWKRTSRTNKRYGTMYPDHTLVFIWNILDTKYLRQVPFPECMWSQWACTASNKILNSTTPSCKNIHSCMTYITSLNSNYVRNYCWRRPKLSSPGGVLVSFLRGGRIVLIILNDFKRNRISRRRMI